LKKVILTTFLTIVLLIISIDVLSIRASGEKVDVSIQLDYNEVEVDVRPSSKALAVFTGKVICEVPVTVQSVDVQLTSAGDWPSEIEPSSVTFISGESSEKSFKITVKVPNFESTNVIGCIETSGRAMVNYPHTSISQYANSAKGYINIKPYMLFDLESYNAESENPIMTGEPGSELFYSFKITNNGNYNEIFNITVFDNGSRILDDWIFHFTEDEFSVKEYQEKLINLTIIIPKDASSGLHQITIGVSSQGKEGDENQIVHNYKIYARVEEKGLLSLNNWFWYGLAGCMLILVILVLVLLVNKKRKTKKH